MTNLPAGVDIVKYEGAGNDFVCIDDRAGAFGPHESQEVIAAICDRHFGVGADGLILLRRAAGATGASLQMVYYNSDGAPSSFCGNGSRCFAQFAHDCGAGLLNDGNSAIQELHFIASDGLHTAQMLSAGRIRVSMRVGSHIRGLSPAADFVDTGSPHYVEWCGQLPLGDLRERARKIRYGEAFAKTGVNVNYVVEESQPSDLAVLRIRTYERGVEDETLACGTGVTAAALSFAERRQLIGPHRITVEAVGGSLAVSLHRDAEGEVQDVWLEGPARRVFAGTFV